MRWLPRLGSNQGFQLQRLTCYRYTTGQFLPYIVLPFAARVKGPAGKARRGRGKIPALIFPGRKCYNCADSSRQGA